MEEHFGGEKKAGVGGLILGGIAWFRAFFVASGGQGL